jgi:hypothetical protein
MCSSFGPTHVHCLTGGFFFLVCFHLLSLSLSLLNSFSLSLALYLLCFASISSRPLPAHFESIISHCIFYAGCRICEEATKRRALLERSLGRGARVNVAGSYALLLNSVGGKLMDADDFVEVAHADPVDLRDEFTIMAWIQTQLPFGRIVDKNRAFSLEGFQLDLHACRPDHTCLVCCFSLHSSSAV